MLKLTPPPSAYGSPLHNINNNVELPAYSPEPLFSNYQSDIKEPPKAKHHEKPSPEVNASEVSAASSPQEFEAGNVAHDVVEYERKVVVRRQKDKGAGTMCGSIFAFVLVFTAFFIVGRVLVH